MAVTNREIADTFDAVADMLQLKGEIIHRVISYRHAAETIRELPRDLVTMVAEGEDLTELPHIGKTLAAKIVEMLESGQLELYERLKGEIPPGLPEIMHISGVGPKRAMQFYNELGITSLAELEKAAKAGKLQELSGLGKKTEQKVLEGIEALARQQTGRMPLGQALPAAEALLDNLLTQPGVIEGAVAGSIRRGRPTIGDVDLLVAVDESADVEMIMNSFTFMANVARVLGQGPSKSSVELLNGLQVDLRVLPKERWGTALVYFTGSQAHNIHIRSIAVNDKQLTLNEHAFSPIDANGDIIADAPKITCATEEAVYAVLDMPWIPPELREDRGEIEAAQANTLPNLITIDDIRADLHMHTTWSDGKLTVQQMAEQALQRGHQYIVITDHSRSLGIANGLTAERLLEQRAEIDAANEALGGRIRIFQGTEMEINADGGLDFPDEVLTQLDFVIASLHVSLRQPREQITERLLNAIRNPHVDMIGHPRGQLIPNREPADLDMDAVFAAAVEHGTALEINANPHRLDLAAEYARRAATLGIPLAINTDAHSGPEFDLLPYGIKTARRGWVEPQQVINTWPVEQFEQWIQSRGR